MSQLMLFDLIQVYSVMHLFDLNELLLLVENLRQHDFLLEVISHFLVQRRLHLLHLLKPFLVLAFSLFFPAPNLLHPFLDLNVTKHLEFMPLLLINSCLHYKLMSTLLQNLSVERLCSLLS
jgi:hypothetical protein